VPVIIPLQNPTGLKFLSLDVVSNRVIYTVEGAEVVLQKRCILRDRGCLYYVSAVEGGASNGNAFLSHKHHYVRETAAELGRDNRPFR
jgi:hypothetical protein